MSRRRIWLVRHGIAEDVPASGRDADRALTGEGRRRTRRAALGLRELGVRPAVVLASPLLRARQTAEIVAEVLDVRLERWDDLAPGLDPGRVSRELDARFAGAGPVLVGHEPHCGELLAYWLTGSPVGLAVRFRKGAVACVAGAMLPPQGRAELEWMLTADQLGALRLD